MILLSAEDLKPDFLFNRAAETHIHEVRSWTSELTVLVVEDDEILQESFQQMLGYLFAEVEAAVDGQDVLDQWVKKPYDIVFTDLNMPRMSGFRLIQKIRQQSPQQVTIVIGAYEDEIFQQVLAVQEVKYLIKPIGFEGLLNVLISVLSKSSFRASRLLRQ